jgi:hypothetical protein
MPLFAATWCLYRVACLVLEQQGAGHEDLDWLYWRGRHAFDVSFRSYLRTGAEEAIPGVLYSLDRFRAVLAETPDDSPCPCGSPFAFGVCCRRDYARLLRKNRRLHERLRTYVDNVLAGVERYQQELPDD